ncbi:MAG: DUF2071 domain-containing protein [Ignavibacteria bacterium]
MSKTFLSAEWRKLLMINYAVDKKILEPFIPFNTLPDLWNGTCYLSLVGFMFLNTRLKNIKIPFHRNFEEVNLRFYVKHFNKEKNEWRRGVVFIKEIVSKRALSFIANNLYKENYETMPMSHIWESDQTSGKLTVEYRWKKYEDWNSIKVITGMDQIEIEKNSEEEFITEHYWGYTKLNESSTSEYGVTHPRWEMYKTIDHSINVNFENTYGNEFSFLKSEKPVSVFLAEGSEIAVKEGGKI